MNYDSGNNFTTVEPGFQSLKNYNNGNNNTTKRKRETKLQPIVSRSSKSASPKCFKNGRNELMLMELLHKTWKILDFGYRSVTMKMRSLKKKCFKFYLQTLYTLSINDW